MSPTFLNCRGKVNLVLWGRIETNRPPADHFSPLQLKISHWYLHLAQPKDVKCTAPPCFPSQKTSITRANTEQILLHVTNCGSVFWSVSLWAVSSFIFSVPSQPTWKLTLTVHYFHSWFWSLSEVSLHFRLTLNIKLGRIWSSLAHQGI